MSSSPISSRKHGKKRQGSFDDSDFDWYREFERPDEEKSNIRNSEKSPKSEKKKKKKRHTSREKYDGDLSPSKETLIKNDDDCNDEDAEASRNILRNHRNSVIASNSEDTEDNSGESAVPNWRTKINLNKSYPMTKTSSLGDRVHNPIPSVISPFRHRPSRSTDYYSFGRSIQHTDTASDLELAPNYNNYQLLGDSQLLRFAENVLSLKPIVNQNADKTKIRYRGYCVSGQTIKELEERLLKRDLKLSKNVIMLIGTNDFLRNNDYESMCASYNSILRNLKDFSENIVLMTVPPIPKFGKGPYWYKFRRFNEHIAKLSEDPMITVVDTATAFIGYDNSTLNQYFEQYYVNNSDRIDLVHLNRKGHLLLKFLLDTHVFNI